MSNSDREITIEEVAKHNNTDSLWMIYENKVLDITNFLMEHPGGDEILLEVAGQDGTSRFRDIGHSKDAVQMTEQFIIGVVKTNAQMLKKTSSGIFPEGKYKNCCYITAATAVLCLGLIIAYQCSRK